jgi:short-subunit dehydrogenase
MRTAIQELIEWTNQYEGKMISADQVILKAYKMLEKEKEQIIKSHIDGFDYIVAEFKKQEYAEEYFNKTYKNQTP